MCENNMSGSASICVHAIAIEDAPHHTPVLVGAIEDAPHHGRRRLRS